MNLAKVLAHLTAKLLPVHPVLPARATLSQPWQKPGARPSVVDAGLPSHASAVFQAHKHNRVEMDRCELCSVCLKREGQ